MGDTRWVRAHKRAVDVGAGRLATSSPGEEEQSDLKEGERV
jgi:hypothetical protein